MIELKPLESLEYYTNLSEQLKSKYEKLANLEQTRLRESGMNYYIPNQVQFRAHQSKARTILLCGANRIGKCVTIGTLIDTLEGEISIGELYRRGKPFKVYAWDGEKKVVANASVPFKKEKHKCYRIKMSDGRQIEAADKHRILTQSGHWAYVSDLNFASSLNRSSSYVSGEYSASVSLQPQEVFSFLPQSNSDTYQSIHASGGLNYERKELDYQDGYLTDFRRYDEPLLGVQDIFQVSSPLRGDARQQLFHEFYLGGLVNKYTDTHQQ